MDAYAEAQLLVGELAADGHAPLHKLIIDHGTSFGPSPLHSDVKPGQSGCCFSNAFNLASAQPNRFIYFEGFARHLFPTAEGLERSSPPTHAWCVDGTRVVDATWVKSRTLRPLIYRGIALPLEMVAPYAKQCSRGPLRHYASTGHIDAVYRALSLDPPW